MNSVRILYLQSSASYGQTFGTATPSTNSATQI